MRIKEITYKRKFNLGNFENKDISLTSEVHPEEDIKEVYLKLKKEIDALCNL